MRTLALVLLSTACGGDEQTTEAAASSPEAGPTFYADVLPIVGENCQQCHNSTSPMGSAFPLEEYAQVKAFAPGLLAKMQPEGDSTDPFFMPPFSARSTEDCTPEHDFKGIYQPTQDDLDVFAAWIEAGTPEGDPADTPEYTVPPVVTLPGEVETLTFSGEYTVPDADTAGYDTFRCFAMQLDNGNFSVDGTVWLDGMAFEPGNSRVAHHMLLFTVPNIQSHMASGLIEDPENNSWTCAGGVSRADGSYPLGQAKLAWGWVPGGLPLELGNGMGMRLEAGTGLVVQMHYNTLAAGDAMTDQSTLLVRPMDELPEREAFFTLFGVASQGASDEVDDPPFEVPLGAANHIESYTEMMGDEGIRLWGFIPHMHLAGTALKYTQVSADGSERCLVNVPRYDYNWQQMYAYDADWADLPVIEGGDALKVECTYDNSDANVMLEKYVGGPIAGGIRLGDGTSDEMCLVGVGLACDGLCD